MAKAVYHKGERVYVKPVGTWAQVEAVLPQWVKGVEEPLKVHYDVGLGREFQAHELMKEQRPAPSFSFIEHENWRIVRARNKSSLESAEATHPFPGTFPVVVTDAQDWGGWRVPAAEYERDPTKFEHQARIIANSLRLFRIASELNTLSGEIGEGAPPRFVALAKDAETVLRLIYAEERPNRPEREDDVSPQLR
jgi:hypothetical protein